MPSPKFKPGDKVRRIISNYINYTHPARDVHIGDIYTVEKCDQTWVTLKNKPEDFKYSEEHFELVSKPLPINYKEVS